MVFGLFRPGGDGGRAAPDHEEDYCDARYLHDENFADAWRAMIDVALRSPLSHDAER